MHIREWQDGDDLKLLEIFGDPASAQHHYDRTMLGPSTQEPFGVGLVAEDDGVPIAAGAIRAQAIHPQRMWCFVETAPLQRRRGIATQLLDKLRASLPAGTELKTRSVSGDDATATWLQNHGFGQIQHSQRVILAAGSFQEPTYEVEPLATGSVALSKVAAAYYNVTHEWDPAHVSITQAQQLLLAPSTGAQQAFVTREADQIIAFGIAYPGPVPNVVDLFVGYDPQHPDPSDHVRSVLAVTGEHRSLGIDIDESTSTLNALLGQAMTADTVLVEHESIIWATDATTDA